MKTGRDCCELRLKSPEDGEEEIQKAAAQEARVDYQDWNTFSHQQKNKEEFFSEKNIFMLFLTDFWQEFTETHQHCHNGIVTPV